MLGPKGCPIQMHRLRHLDRSLEVGVVLSRRPLPKQKKHRLPPPQKRGSLDVFWHAKLKDNPDLVGGRVSQWGKQCQRLGSNTFHCPGLLKRYMLQPFEPCFFFNTKIKRNHHLQGNAQVYNVRIPVWPFFLPALFGPFPLATSKSEVGRTGAWPPTRRPTAATLTPSAASRVEGEPAPKAFMGHLRSSATWFDGDFSEVAKYMYIYIYILLCKHGRTKMR